MTQAELLARQLDDSRQWTLALIDDLQGDDWSYQPGPGLGHALWHCGHLTSAQDTLIHTRCLDHSIIDRTFGDHFPIGGPVKSTAEHDYPSVDEVVAGMADMHAKTCAAVRTMTDDLLAEPAFGKDGKTPHPHYTDKVGAICHCNRHEAFHAGQLSLIRRLLGKTFLR